MVPVKFHDGAKDGKSLLESQDELTVFSFFCIFNGR
jgi:hypothetical protein